MGAILKNILLAGLLGVFPIITAQPLYSEIDDKEYERLSTFSEVLFNISKYYVKETPPESLIIDAINGMMKNLDPNSAFLTPDLYKDFKKITEGRFSGVGIEVTIQNGELIVVSTMDDTPAKKAGIASQDKIVEINGKDTRNVSLFDANLLLIGEEKSKIKLKILQKSTNKIKEFELTREIIKIQSVSHKKLKGKIGYIKIKNFQTKTSFDVRRALDQLLSSKIMGLILDLRDNPGGILEEAVRISDFFLKKGIIVVVKERAETKEFNANEDEDDIVFPIVAIANGGSASAAEILVAALQENNRLKFVGEKTFGKGTVQQLFKLKDDYGLKLTVAEYLSPNKNHIHNKGICPNIIVSNEKDQMDTAIKYLKSPWKVKDAICQ